MSSRPSRAQGSPFADETEVRALYRQILSAWNRGSADSIAELFAEDGEVIGFDGSRLKGRAEIAAVHKQIFEDPETGAFVGKVRSVRCLGPGVAVASAVAGMVMPGRSDLEADRNLVQTLVAVNHGDAWRAAVFQNTPAQLYGRPEESQALTEELRRQL